MNLKLIIKDTVLMTVATFIIAAAVYLFLMPSHAAISSIAGLCIVLSNFIPLSVATLSMILNVALLIIGFAFLGREFGIKTVYTSILLPAFLWMFELLMPDDSSMTNDATLDVICYIFLVSIGLGILFTDNASSGGLDIVAKLINKYFHVEIGKALSVAGICIALSSALAYDAKTVILSLIGTYLNGIVLDQFIFGMNIKKRVCIIPTDEKKMKDFILNQLHSGATIYEATGAYDGTKRNEIITIVDKHEYQRLMSFIENEDPKAFVTVYTVNEIRYIPKM